MGDIGPFITNFPAALDAVKATAARRARRGLDRLSPQRGFGLRPGRRNGAFRSNEEIVGEKLKWLH